MLVQSTPFVPILLKPFANETGVTLPIEPRDHALTAGLSRQRFLDKIEVDSSMPESHLCFDIHPDLFPKEHRLTTRDFYKLLNVHFAPNGSNVEWMTENAIYLFENAVLTFFPQRNPRASLQNGGYIRCDYKLLSKLQQLSLASTRNSHFTPHLDSALYFIPLSACIVTPSPSHMP